ncbi:hypothetical protein [Cellulomonas sp. Marseille-Q8402]
MPRLARRPAGVLLAVAAATLALVGCSGPTQLGERAASDAVVQLLEPTVFHSYAPDIVEFAEHVQGATEGGGIVLLGVEEGDASARDDGEAIGWITLGLTVSDTRAPTGYWGSEREQDPGPYCFRVAFDHWGVDDIRGADCPEQLVAVDAPPSERPRIAANAEEAVWSVLTGLPADLPPEADVAAQVTALLEPHANGVTPLAEVTVAVDGGTIAVATGDEDDCVLVARSSDGVVRDVHVPSVYLLPGELGCTAGTAFADLRPPH